MALSEKTCFVNAEDSVIILDLLYFVFNKLKTTPVKNVVQIAHAFYTDNDLVFGEKKKLCDAVGEPCSVRRSDSKRLENIKDICQVLTRRDSGNKFLPTFASVNLNCVPLNEEGNPTLGQILPSINDLKRNTVTKDKLEASLNDFRKEITSSSVSSVATPLSEDSSASIPFRSSVVSSASSPPPPVSPSAPSAPLWGDASDGISASAPDLSVIEKNPTMNEIVKSKLLPGQKEDGRGRPPKGEAGKKVVGGGGGGGVVRGDRRQNNRSSSKSKTIIGKSVSNGLLSFKGVDQTINKYIGRVHNDVSVDDFRQQLVGAGVDVVELEQLETKHSRFKSFRLRLKKVDLGKIKSEDFWPEGVVVSHFYRPRVKDDQRNAETGSGRGAQQSDF